jgi:plasmid stabilization system protein ParE
MTYRISYLEKAITEYEAAVEWYAERSEEAAVKFIIAVKEKMDILRSNPQNYKKPINTSMKFR